MRNFLVVGGCMVVMSSCSWLQLELVRVPDFVYEWLPQKEVSIEISGADEAELYINGVYIGQGPTTLPIYVALAGFVQRVEAYSLDGCAFGALDLAWDQPINGFGGQFFAPADLITIAMEPFAGCPVAAPEDRKMPQKPTTIKQPKTRRKK